MNPERRRKLREYGLTSGTLGSNAAQTLMVVLLPVLLEPHAPSAIWIGAVIGSEGVMAILIPFWIGHLSDVLPRQWAERYGRRALFLWLSTPVMVAALLAVPFLNTFWLLAGAGLIFFAALHIYLTPLWALLIDAVPDERRAPVQGVRGAFQAGGLGFGLIAGGLLLALWQPLPFIVAAALVVATTWMTVVSIPRDRGRRLAQMEQAEELRTFWRRLADRPAAIWFLVANAMWTGAVDGIRPYVFIFATVVLGITLAEASLVLAFLLVGLGIGAVLIGRIGNKVGRARVLTVAAVATTVIMGLGVFVRDVPSAIVLLGVAGVSAAAFISLPFPVFASLAGEEAAGRQTALYVISMGLARLVAPIMVGAAIDWGAAFLPDLQGYPFMWPMAGAFCLLSIPTLLRAVSLADRPAEEI